MLEPAVAAGEWGSAHCQECWIDEPPKCMTACSSYAAGYVADAANTGCRICADGLPAVGPLNMQHSMNLLAGAACISHEPWFHQAQSLTCSIMALLCVTRTAHCVLHMPAAIREDASLKMHTMMYSNTHGFPATNSTKSKHTVAGCCCSFQH
jgi:hypothetical protein